MNVFLQTAVLAMTLIPTTLYAIEKPRSGAEEAGGKSETVDMRLVTREGGSEPAGTIRIEEKTRGIVLTPNLQGLKPGAHGFHMHENADCSPKRKEAESDNSPEVIAGGSAGGHYNPGLTGGHTGPYGEGHLGDLPNLYVDSNGRGNHPVYAPRLRLQDLPNHALVIHARTDNYSDDPEENGGSGRIVACGVLE